VHLAELLLTLVLAANPPGNVKTVVARVNGDPITAAEVETVFAERRAALGMAYRGANLAERVAEEYRRTLGELIEQRMLVQAAYKELPEEERIRLQRRFEDYIRRHPEQVRSMLQRSRRRPGARGVTPAERKQLIALLLVEEVVRRKTKFDSLRISPKELWDYYRTHKKEFHVPEMVTVQMIFIEKDFYKGKGGSRQIAKAVGKKLAAGVSFSALARAYSNGPQAQEGGLWRGLRRGVLKPEIEKAVFALEPGKTSDWVENEDGYFLGRLVKRTKARDIPFEEAQEAIKRRMSREAILKNIQAWLVELKRSAHVEILLGNGK
jgi:peptidyl-prolyl cis-trans isomerase SurA